MPRTGTRGNHGQFARNIETAEQDGKAAALKAQNWTYQQIGDELGLSRSGAFRAVERALNAAVVPGAQALRLRAFARYEYLWECLLPGIEAGDEKAVAEGRKVTEALAKLFRLGELELPAEVDERERSAVDALLAEASKIVETEQAKIYGARVGQ